MRRVALVVTVAFAAFIGSPAALADPPSVHDLDLTELEPAQIQCGDRTLTLTRGTLNIREHLHQLGAGKTRIVFVQRMRDGRLVDAEGGTYSARLVSTGNIVVNETAGTIGGHVEGTPILGPIQGGPLSARRDKVHFPFFLRQRRRTPPVSRVKNALFGSIPSGVPSSILPAGFEPPLSRVYGLCRTDRLSRPLPHLRCARARVP
jgi:hypothetical protein